MAPAPLTEEYLHAFSGQKLVNTSIAFLVLETVFVALRFWARHLKGPGLGLDDILIIPSYILCIGLCGLAIGFVEHGGVGRHAAALAVLDPEALIYMGKGAIALACLYFPAVAISKLSILALYYQAFPVRTYRRIIQVLAAIIGMNMVACVITVFFSCKPIAFYWNKNIPGGHCIDQFSFFEWASLPNIITDAIMLFLPMRVVWNLQTNPGAKLSLAFVFLTGSIGMAIPIVRFVIYSRENIFEDPPWKWVDGTIYTVIEPGLYVTASCLLTFRPFLVYFKKEETSRSNFQEFDPPPSKRKLNPFSITMDTTINNTIREDAIPLKEGSHGPMPP